MSSCILTVIKNEHEYLKEWIDYHLNLGINHIFIFEDLDSLSHRKITEMYKDTVSLNSVDLLLTDDEKRLAIEFKKNKRKNTQDIYLKNGLSYIKETYFCKYDWCFVIDVDEFIILSEGDKTLDKTLLLYSDYDALIMAWECYGADGRINKPDYKKGGVVDYFTKKMCGFMDNHPACRTKTCYNLNKFNFDFYKNNHQPSDYCKWCRSDLSTNRLGEIYDNIYIRHYITKSWEEYIDKKYNRGFFIGFSRDIDFFFKINTDMMHLKEKLVKSLDKKTLVILPYKKQGSQGNEICIALRCWEKFCTFNYHMIVIGEFDDELEQKFPSVEFIKCNTIETNKKQYTPHLDIMHKFKVVMDKYGDEYDGFIYTTDDEYPVKKFSLKDITDVHYRADSFIGDKDDPPFSWKNNEWKTRQLLDRENLPCVDYTTHYPCYFELDKLKEICDKFNMDNESYVFEDVYYNYFSHEEPILDEEIRLGVWNKRIFNENFNNAISDIKIKFVCNSVRGWSKELENELEKILNE